jgi:RNA polymerase sigma factor (TIGR02999 family)
VSESHSASDPSSNPSSSYPTDPGEITRLLHRAADGEDDAFEEVVSLVYSDLQRVAQRRLRSRFAGDPAALTLDPSALVNETLLKIVRSQQEFVNRRHFYAFASRVMMRVLLDYQRRRNAEKRGGDQVRVTLVDVVASSSAGISPHRMAELIEEIDRLDPRKAEIVKLKVFWGLEHTEIAQTLEVSLSTVERDWRFAKTWLAAELDRT